MKAVQLYEYGGFTQLFISDITEPVIKSDQVLVRVKAASVNPIDWKICSGAVRKSFDFQLPFVPGGDFSGVVVSVGNAVDQFSPGDEVFGITGLIGAYAELIAVDYKNVAHKPKNFTFEKAASLPLAGLTAWQALEGSGSCHNKHVLIHNAAGGVGSFAVQIAKARGAKILATASPKNAEFVRNLGADSIVDFRVDDVARYSRDIDILIDMVGGDDGLALWPLVKAGGQVVRVAAGSDGSELADRLGLSVCSIMITPNGTQLDELASMAERGQLVPEVSAIYPIASIAEAFELSRSGHTKGKIVLTF